MILFDVSRLISRAGRQTPTGIDRVELAYAEHLAAGAAPVRFTMLTRLGRFGLLPERATRDYVRTIAGVWRGGANLAQQTRRTRQLARALHFAALRHGEHTLRARSRSPADQPVYLLVSHHHLEKRGALVRLKQQLALRFVCLIHDLIPIEFPEYALPGQDDKHRRRIETAAALADAVIVNSSVTREAFQPYLTHCGRAPPLLVAPFGVEMPAPPPRAPPAVGHPYFVCVGTIEARKNHLLLLNLWRQLVAEFGDATPRLVLIGQRGWEAETAIDMLERCPALRGAVLERSNVPDAEAGRLLRGAQALLLPSFAEGFGFPLVEALALQVPVLCSNLAALRENGGPVPEYFDPIDGAGWRSAVIDYSLPNSARRQAQLDRLAGWKPVSWSDHFSAVDALVTAAGSTGTVPAETRSAPSRRLSASPG